MDILRNTIIKKLSIDDLFKIQMFHVEHSKNYKISETNFKNYLTLPQYSVFAITTSSQVILGYIILQIALNEADIIYICVHMKYRNQGIATKILQCSTWNIQKIFLEVSIDNLAAISLYKKCGFSILNTRKNYINSKDAYLMVKNNINP
jgi:ribosomal-protein-alanine N-acetyltransferase